LFQQSIKDVKDELANVGDFSYMTSQLLEVIKSMNFQTEAVKLVYSTSVEMQSIKLPEVNIYLQIYNIKELVLKQCSKFYTSRGNIVK
jgi:hypothetical protein